MMARDIALITGSSKGLGLAIAKMLASKNVKVILTGRSQFDLNQALSAFPNNEHTAFIVDFCQDTECDQLLDFLVEKKLIPTTLVHNLGGRVEGDIFPLDSEALRRSLKFNLEIAVKINEKFLPYMLKRGQGKIIHIGSDASLTGRASPAYVIAKAALNGYIKTMSQFYAKNSILICGVLPGIMEHENSVWAQKKINQPEYYQKKLEQMPLGRFGTVEEIAIFVSELAKNGSMMCTGGLFELCGAAR